MTARLLAGGIPAHRPESTKSRRAASGPIRCGSSHRHPAAVGAGHPRRLPRPSLRSTSSAYATPVMVGGGKNSTDLEHRLPTYGITSFNFPVRRDLEHRLLCRCPDRGGWRRPREQSHCSTVRQLTRGHAMNAVLIALIRVVVVLTAAFVVAPAIVIVISAFNDAAFLSFPPQALLDALVRSRAEQFRFSRRLCQQSLGGRLGLVDRGRHRDVFCHCGAAGRVCRSGCSKGSSCRP